MNDYLKMTDAQKEETAGEGQPKYHIPEISHYTDATIPITRNEVDRPGRHIRFHLRSNGKNGHCPHGTSVIGLYFLSTGRKEVYCLGTNGSNRIHELTLTDDEKKSIGALANALFVKHVPGSTREEARMLRPDYSACEYTSM
jgi:hypothetical protein